MSESWKGVGVGKESQFGKERKKGIGVLLCQFYEGKKKKAKRHSFKGSPYPSRIQLHLAVPEPHPTVPNFFFYVPRHTQAYPYPKRTRYGYFSKRHVPVLHRLYVSNLYLNI